MACGRCGATTDLWIYGTRTVCRPCKRARLKRWRRTSRARRAVLSEQRDMVRIAAGMIATLHRYGWTDVRIAARTGVSRQTVIRWRKGANRHIQRPAFVKLADSYVAIVGERT